MRRSRRRWRRATRATVDRYLIWNEPNQKGWLQPQWEKSGHSWIPVAPHIYRDLVNAAGPAIKKADPGAEIVIGELAPVGNKPISAETPMKPLPFLRSFGCVDDKYKSIKSGLCKGFKEPKGTTIGYHPHPKKLAPDKPNPDVDDAQFADLPRLFSTIDKLRSRHRISVGTNVNLTEFGYETNPPDKASGVSLALQARYLQQASYLAWKYKRVRGLSFYQWFDEPTLNLGPGTKKYSGWQTGLRFNNGEAKPALSVMPAPFVIDQVKGATSATFWGQVRPDANPQVTIQTRAQGRLGLDGRGDGQHGHGRPVVEEDDDQDDVVVSLPLAAQALAGQRQPRRADVGHRRPHGQGQQRVPRLPAVLMRRWLGAGAVAGMLAFAAPASAGAAAPIDLGAGGSASLTVDPAGTSHIVFDMPGGEVVLPHPEAGVGVRRAHVPAAGRRHLDTAPTILRRPSDGALFIIQATKSEDDVGTTFMRSSGDSGVTWTPPAAIATGDFGFSAVALAPSGASAYTLSFGSDVQANPYVHFVNAPFTGGQTNVLNLISGSVPPYYAKMTVLPDGRILDRLRRRRRADALAPVHRRRSDGHSRLVEAGHPLGDQRPGTRERARAARSCSTHGRSPPSGPARSRRRSPSARSTRNGCAGAPRGWPARTGRCSAGTRRRSRTHAGACTWPRR